MAKAISQSMMVLSVLALVGGCQSIGRIQFSHRIEADAAMAERNRTLFTMRGADLLRAGNNGQAIEAYNLALATGEEPAPAYNGLGVAYARLGRPDLAYRFFKKATMGAPDNAVFARNLARLMDSPEFADEMARRSERRKVSEPANSLAASQSASVDPVVREAGKLYRDGDRQFTLITSPAPMASAAVDRNGLGKSCSFKAKHGQADNCTASGLPQTASRQRKSSELALNRADLSTDSSQPNATPGEAGASDPQGKRKIIEMPVAARNEVRTESPGRIAS